MKKDFLSNAGLMMGVNLLIKPLWIFAIDRNVQNILGPVEYGHYAALFSFSMILAVLLDLGINNYTSTQVARHPERIGNYMSVTLSAKLFFAVLYILVTLLAAFLTGYKGKSILLLLFLMAGQILSFTHTYFRSHFSGLHRFKTDSFLSASDRLFMMIFAACIIWGNWVKLTVQWWIAIQVSGYFLAACISFIILKPYMKHVRLIWKRELLAEILKASFPYALLALVMTAYMRCDTILLQRMLPDGDYENGIYAQGYRLLEAGNMMIALVSVILLPMFSRMFAKKEDINPLIHLASAIMILPAMIITIHCVTYNSELMNLLYKEGGTYSAQVFSLIICSFLPYTFMYLFGTLLTAHGNLKQLIVLSFIALIINIGLNYFLIPTYKAYGAAISALVTNAFVAISNTFAAYQIRGIKFDFNYAIKVIFLSVFVWLVSISTHHFISGWLFAFAISIVFSISGIFIFRFISLREISQTFKSKA